MNASPDPSSSHRIRWSGWTHRGRVRAQNEDAFLAVVWDAREVRYLGKIGEMTLEMQSGENFLFAVSDGMGGERGGAFASKLVVQYLAEWLPRLALQSETPSGQLPPLFQRINDKLNHFGQAYEECRGMGATLSLVWLTQGQVVYGHVGDSRLYHLPAGGELRQITQDDTQVGWLFKNGKINEREARTHPAKSRLSKVLGNGIQRVHPQTGSLPMATGDRYLLCSDGVVDGLWNRSLESTLAKNDIFCASESPGVSLAEQLVNAAVAESGRDNVTAISLEISPNLG